MSDDWRMSDRETQNGAGGTATSNTDYAMDDMEGCSEDENATEGRIQELITRLESVNPYTEYQSCIELLQLLRSEGRLEELRQWRTRVSDFFALNPDLYLQWVEDELELMLGQSEEETLKLVGLFDKAVQEYLSWDLWSKYLLFAVEYLPVGAAGSLMERACGVFKYDPQQAHHPYWIYIEFVQQALLSVEEKGRKIRQLYHDLLKVPHVEHEQTFEKYRNWENEQEDNKAVGASDDRVWFIKQNGYDIAVAELEEINSWFDSVEADPSHEAFRDCIDKIRRSKSLKHPQKQGITVILFEKDILVNMLREDVWKDYLAYIQVIFKGDIEKTNALLSRAIRNTTWSVDLWVMFLLSLENMGNGDNDAIFERAKIACLPSVAQDLEKCIKLALIRCDIARRSYVAAEMGQMEKQQSVRQIFAKLKKWLHSLHPIGDPLHRLDRYHAKIEADEFGDLESARKIWKQSIMHESSQALNYAAVWLAYVDFEKLFFGFKQNKVISGIFRRSLSRKDAIETIDYPEEMVNSWLRYEGEFGTIDSYLATQAETEKLNRDIVSRRRRETIELGKQWEEAEKHRTETSGKKRSRNGDADNIVEEKPAKHMKPLIEHAETDETKQKRTIFVANLPPSMTEEVLSEYFKDVGGSISSIRLIKDEKSAFKKTFAYIEFSDEAAVKEALLKDRIPVKGLASEQSRPMYVSPFIRKDKQPATASKPQIQLEPKVLYITGLPVSISAQSLTDFFSKYAKPKSVRLINDEKHLVKSKRPFAYIEYDNEDQAKSTLNLDGAELYGEKIKVEISRVQSAKKQMASSLGGFRSKAPGGRSMALSLVPRVVPKKPEMAPDELKFTAASISTPGANASTPEKADRQKKPVSNADFRAMFLKK